MKKLLLLTIPLVFLGAGLTSCDSGGGSPSDTISPTISLVNETPVTTRIGSPVNIQVRAQDNVAIKEVQCYLDNDVRPFAQVATATNGIYTCTTPAWTAIQVGTHSVRVVAVDTSGNTSASSAVSITVQPELDTIKPTVTLLSPGSVTTNGIASIQVNAQDNVAVKEVQCFLDGQNTPFTLATAGTGGSYTCTTQGGLQDGVHTVRVVAVDISGNISDAAAVSITVDTVKPVVTFNGLPSGTITSPNTYNLSMNATDNTGVTSVTATLTQTVNGTTTTLINQTTTDTAFALPLSVSSAMNGTYTLTVTAYDAAGNSTTEVRTVTVDIPATSTTPGTGGTPGTGTTPDTSKPVITITGLPTTTITTAGSYDVTVQATDNVAVTSLTATLTLPFGLSVPFTLETSGGTQRIEVDSRFNGTSTLTVTAKDAAGNTTTETRSVTVQIP